MRYYPARLGELSEDGSFHRSSSACSRPALATLEFALVAPVFFALVLGIIEVGRGLMITNLLNNAARAGCREGILSGKSDSDITSAISTLVSKQGITGHTVSVQVNNVVANASTAQSQDEVTVKVKVPVSQVTWLPGGNFLKGNLSGQYSLRRE